MNLLRRILLLTLTLHLLVSTTGMSVGMHVCGGKIQDLRFFGKAADCPMEQQKAEKLPPCHATPENKAAAEDCCQNTVLELESLEEASESKVFILSKTFQPEFLAAFHAVILHLFAPEAVLAPAFTLYTSPPIARDIPVLVQSFLL